MMNPTQDYNSRASAFSVQHTHQQQQKKVAKKKWNYWTTRGTHSPQPSTIPNVMTDHIMIIIHFLFFVFCSLVRVVFMYLFSCPQLHSNIDDDANSRTKCRNWLKKKPKTNMKKNTKHIGFYRRAVRARRAMSVVGPFFFSRELTTTSGEPYAWQIHWWYPRKQKMSTFLQWNIKYELKKTRLLPIQKKLSVNEIEYF